MSEADKILYHYCSPESFFKILQTQQLRFSDITSFNDYEEGLQILKYVKGNLKSKKYSEKISRLKESYNKIRAGFPSIDNFFCEPKEWPLKTYACCFSESADSLSQWRSYAANGDGFAIGFQRRNLKQMTFQKEKAELFRVKYKPDEAILLAHELLSTIDYKVALGDLIDNLTIEEVASVYYKLAVSIKSSGFSEEKEHRLIFQPQNINQKIKQNLSYSLKTNTMIFSYFQVNFNSKAINAIHLGPTNANIHNINNLEAACDHYLGIIPKIKVSKLSYRN